jgi:hypothetical protein
MTLEQFKKEHSGILPWLICIQKYPKQKDAIRYNAKTLKNID